MKKKPRRKTPLNQKKIPLTSKAINWIPRFEVGLALCLLAIIVYLHFVVLMNAGGLWRDEANSAQFALMPSLSQIASSLRFDPNPVASTIIFRLWTSIAASDQGFRVLGLFVGIGITAAFWWNARMLGIGIPLFSLTLFTLNPIAVRYGDSVRPYGLGIAFALTTIGLIWKVAMVPSWRWAGAACLSAVLSVQCLFQDSFLLLAICMGGAAVAWRHREPRRAGLIIAIGIIAALSLLPYIRTIESSREWNVVNQSSVNLAALWDVLSQALSAPGTILLWVWIGLSIIGTLLGAICLLIFDQRMSERRKDLLSFSIIVYVLSTVGFLAMIRSTNLPSQPWYYLPLMAVCAVCLDALYAVFLYKPPMRLARAFVVVILTLLSAPNLLEGIRIRATNIDLIASHLAANAAKQDLIVVSPWHLGISFHRAYQGATPWMSLPPMKDLTIHRYDLLKDQMESANPLQPLVEAMTKTLSSGNRIWVIGGIDIPPPGQPPASLPRAPNGPGGWNNGPYLLAWMRQLGFFLQSHALDGEQVHLQISQQVSSYENAPLLVFKGWRP